VGKCGIYKQAIDDNTIVLMPFAQWITKTKDTHTAFVILYLRIFRDNYDYENAPQCCIIRTLPVLFMYKYSNHAHQ
jgi:hypothetical protein